MIGYEFDNLKKYKGLKHIVTDRMGGFSVAPYESLNLALHVNDCSDHVLRNRAAAAKKIGYSLENIVVMDLVHGSNVAIIKKEDKRQKSDVPIPQTDAVITNKQNIVLTVFVADCVPAIIYDPENHALALIHGGWKSLSKNITEKTIDKMILHFGSDPKKLVAGIGPAVCGKCYDVYESVANEIIKNYPDLSKQVLTKNKGRIYLDIQKLMKLQLEKKGVRNIETANICTYENKDFYSYRRDHETGRFGIFAVLK